MKKKLTKTVVMAADYTGHNDSLCVVWDTEVRGFGLRIRPSGHKSFLLSYRTTEGQKKFYSLGNAATLTPMEARDKARRLLVSVRDGNDPQAEKVKKRESLTVADLCDKFIADYAKTHKKTWRDDEKRFKRHVKNSFLAKCKIADVKRSDVARLLHEIAKPQPKLTKKGKPIIDDQGEPIMIERGHESNRVQEILRRAFNLASREWGLLDERHPNPATGIQRSIERSRTRWVDPSGLPILIDAIMMQKDVYIRNLFLLYLMTGLRHSELLGLHWSDINFEEKKITLGMTKNGEEFVLPISTPIMEVFKALPRVNEYVFPGRYKKGHLVNFRDSWKEIKKTAKMNDLRIHDLRRSAGSLMASDGVSLVEIGELLNQSAARATEVYAKVYQERKRRTLEKHAARIVAVTLNQSPEEQETARLMAIADEIAASTLLPDAEKIAAHLRQAAKAILSTLI